MLFQLSQIKFNPVNLDHFVRHYTDYLCSTIQKAGILDEDAYGDVNKALTNVRATLKLAPHLASNLNVSAILSDPNLLLDAGDVEFEHLLGDLNFLWKLTTHSLSRLKEQDKSSAIRIAIALYDALRSEDDMAQVCERVAKLLAQHGPGFFKIAVENNDNGPSRPFDIASLKEELQ